MSDFQYTQSTLELQGKKICCSVFLSVEAQSETCNGYLLQSLAVGPGSPSAKQAGHRLPPGFRDWGEGTTYLCRCVIRGGLRLAPGLQNSGRAAPTSQNCEIRRGICWLRGFGIRGGHRLVPGLRNEAKGSRMVTFPRGPSTSVSGASTGSRKAPRSPCGAAHTCLTPAPGTAQPRSSRPFGRSLSGALRTRNAERRTSGPQPRSWRVHPACTPISPTRRPKLCEVTRLPPRRLRPARSRARTAPGACPAALALRGLEHVARCSAAPCLPRHRSRPAPRSPRPARPRLLDDANASHAPAAYRGANPCPRPQDSGLEMAALAADWWEQVPLKASNAGTGQQAGRGRAVPSWAGCTTLVTRPGHWPSSPLQDRFLGPSWSNPTTAWRNGSGRGCWTTNGAGKGRSRAKSRHF